VAELVILTPAQLAERDTPQPKGRGRSGRRRTPERERIIEAYKATMRAAEPGYGAEVVLAPDEEKREVRRNLKAAAAELDQVLDFRPVKDKGRISFRFITPEERAARPKRGGRPRTRPAVEQNPPQEATPPVPAEQPAAAPTKRPRRRATSRQSPHG